MLIADIQDVLQNPQRRAHLQEILDIYGFSGSGWTPMMWKLRVVYEGEPPANRLTDEWQFDPETDVVHEFLYLRCDHNGGNRAFGPNGRYNATLLWPDALRYFMKHMDVG